VDLLKTTFPDEALNFVEVKDSGKTGNFEIKVNGNLVHSKRERGNGFLTAANGAPVFEAVEAAAES